MSWRTRQQVVYENRGKTTTLILRHSTEFDAYHVKRYEQIIGGQRATTYHTVLPYDEALAVWAGMVNTALAEDFDIKARQTAIVDLTDVIEADG